MAITKKIINYITLVRKRKLRIYSGLLSELAVAGFGLVSSLSLNSVHTIHFLIQLFSVIVLAHRNTD